MFGVLGVHEFDKDIIITNSVYGRQTNGNG